MKFFTNDHILYLGNLFLKYEKIALISFFSPLYFLLLRVGGTKLVSLDTPCLVYHTLYSSTCPTLEIKSIQSSNCLQIGIMTKKKSKNEKHENAFAVRRREIKVEPISEIAQKLNCNMNIPSRYKKSCKAFSFMQGKIYKGKFHEAQSNFSHMLSKIALYFRLNKIFLIIE